MSLEDIFEDAIALVGSTLSNGSYDIWRPDYESATTDDVCLVENLAIRAEPSRANPEPKVAGVEYYYVAMRASLVEPGDLLVPNENQISIPMLTVQNKDSSFKDVCAFRTNRIGTITSSVRAENPIFSNVPFDWVSTVTPEEALNAGFDGSQEYELRKLAMFSRIGTRIKKGMYFIDQDDIDYVIRSVANHGPTTTLLVSEK